MNIIQDVWSIINLDAFRVRMDDPLINYRNKVGNSPFVILILGAMARGYQARYKNDVLCIEKELDSVSLKTTDWAVKLRQNTDCNKLVVGLVTDFKIADNTQDSHELARSYRFNGNEYRIISSDSRYETAIKALNNAAFEIVCQFNYPLAVLTHLAAKVQDWSKPGIIIATGGNTLDSGHIMAALGWTSQDNVLPPRNKTGIEYNLHSQNMQSFIRDMLSQNKLTADQLQVYIPYPRDGLLRVDESMQSLNLMDSLIERPSQIKENLEMCVIWERQGESPELLLDTRPVPKEMPVRIPRTLSLYYHLMYIILMAGMLYTLVRSIDIFQIYQEMVKARRQAQAASMKINELNTRLQEYKNIQIEYNKNLHAYHNVIRPGPLLHITSQLVRDSQRLVNLQINTLTNQMVKLRLTVERHKKDSQLNTVVNLPENYELIGITEEMPGSRDIPMNIQPGSQYDIVVMEVLLKQQTAAFKK